MRSVPSDRESGDNGKTNGRELVEGEHAVAVAVGLDEDAVDEALQLEVGDARDEHAAHAVRVRVRDEAVPVVVKHVECNCVDW